MAIVGFRHKGLERFFLSGDRGGIQPKHADKLRVILGRLTVSTSPSDMRLPGLALHRLIGNRQDTWAVKISGNWRITFRYDGEDIAEVNYEDYH